METKVDLQFSFTFQLSKTPLHFHKVYPSLFPIPIEIVQSWTSTIFCNPTPSLLTSPPSVSRPRRHSTAPPLPCSVGVTVFGARTVFQGTSSFQEGNFFYQYHHHETFFLRRQAGSINSTNATNESSISNKYVWCVIEVCMVTGRLRTTFKCVFSELIGSNALGLTGHYFYFCIVSSQAMEPHFCLTRLDFFFLFSFGISIF